MGVLLWLQEGKPPKQSTTSTIAKRLQICQANKTRNWGHVMFFDRKKFSFRYPGSQVKHVEWVRKGQQRQAYTPNHPMVLNVYAGITEYGVTMVHKVTSKQQNEDQFQEQSRKGSHEYYFMQSMPKFWKTLYCQRAVGSSTRNVYSNWVF